MENTIRPASIAGPAANQPLPYFNRDLSWLDFNGRVLGEGLRKDLPPLDRLKFLSIVSSNFDEFFMVRVAAMKRAMRAGAGPDPSGLLPQEQIRAAAEKVRDITGRQYRCLREEIFPALAQNGLELVRPDAYSLEDMDYLEAFFLREVYPVLTPLRLKTGEAAPAIGSLSLHAAFLLSADPEPAGTGETADNQNECISIVQIPAVVDRIVPFPKGRWALLDDMLLTWGSYLFPGYRVRESMLFKVSRDADFSVDEQRDEDFIEAMEEVLYRRESSRAVRMVYAEGGLTVTGSATGSGAGDGSQRLRDALASLLKLGPEDLYGVEGPLDLPLAEIVSARDFERLRAPPRKVYPSPRFSADISLWEQISQADMMLHLPYQAFDPVVRFFQEAAADPAVISIKTALYRTSGDSPIVRALEEAALKGKHVTAVVELKARFDEERNISWARNLERAGVIVIYGLARVKVHAKISLVLRREQGGIKRYVHLSTGNYNDRTAKLYDDIGLFTAREDIAFDAGLLFNMITGYSVIRSMRQLVIAPAALKEGLLAMIHRELSRSTPENPGRIMAKMNALADPEVIGALYRASQAGVRIDLCIRGICMLVPGLPGRSEHIRVTSIVDQYLEHSRIYYFANGGAEEFYLSSADWMPRNLERRIELMFPVLQEDLRAELRDVLEAYFRDNCQAWVLGSDGCWTRRTPGADAPFSVQEYFLSQAAAQIESSWKSGMEFIVRRSPPEEKP
ncbi:MAG: polyphosphate kinase 1 [Treponema sp.]|jgi:polyphosphate kinase|nr:polyphosphate kinase 1 [Treponema sp.]